MKSIKNFEGQKIELSSVQLGGVSETAAAIRTSQAWDGGRDKIRNDGSIKTNIDWNPFNNDAA